MDRASQPEQSMVGGWNAPGRGGLRHVPVVMMVVVVVGVVVEVVVVVVEAVIVVWCRGGRVEKG